MTLTCFFCKKKIHVESEECEISPSWQRGKWKCEKCKQDEWNELCSDSTKVNAELGLPALIGSVAQKQWAEVIRRRKIETLNREIEKEKRIYTNGNETLSVLGLKDVTRERIDAALQVIVSKDLAKWWIDKRNTDIIKEFKDIYIGIDEPLSPEDQAIMVDLELAAKAEATLTPNSPITKTAAEIRTGENNIIKIHFPEKRDDFREIIKKLHFRWSNDSKCWYRIINEKSGTLKDRSIEACHALLSNNFIVRVYDCEIRRNAIDGVYEEEHLRWIATSENNEYKGWFEIKWWERNEHLYSAARKIKGSKYDKKQFSVVVPPEQFEEIQDFADIYDFRFTKEAIALSASASELQKKALFSPVKVKSRAKKKILKNPVISNRVPDRIPVPISIEVADELKD